MSRLPIACGGILYVQEKPMAAPMTDDREELEEAFKKAALSYRQRIDEGESTEGISRYLDRLLDEYLGKFCS